MDKKYTLTIRMDGKTEQEIREKMDDAHVRSLNAFVLKAIDFYLGYLRQGKNLNFISPILASSIKSEIKNTEHNLSEMVYKMAVQLSMLTQIVADDKNFIKQIFVNGFIVFKIEITFYWFTFQFRTLRKSDSSFN